MSSAHFFLVSTQIKIPWHEIRWQFVRSSGAGGQNVNKVNSQVILRWNLLETEVLSDELKFRLLDFLQNKLSSSGELQVRSQEERDQNRNREICLSKLKTLLLEASYVPKVRKATKPSKSAQRKRLDSKKRHKDKKQNRRTKDWL